MSLATAQKLPTIADLSARAGNKLRAGDRVAVEHFRPGYRNEFACYEVVGASGRQINQVGGQKFFNHTKTWVAGAPGCGFVLRLDGSCVRS